MNKVYVDIVRFDMDENRTFGRMFLDGKYFCYTLEDEDREYLDGKRIKVQKKTAIWCGEYPLLYTDSTRFKRKMPLIANVTGFRGIRIHGGNTTEDTEGCVLVGQKADKDMVRLINSHVYSEWLNSYVATMIEKNELICRIQHCAVVMMRPGLSDADLEANLKTINSWENK